MTVFTPTRHDNPCPICSDTTGKCRETAHVQLCMTMADAMHYIPGFRFIGQTKNNLWGKWVAQTTPRTVRSNAVTPLRKCSLSKKNQKDGLLSAEERDRLYTQLFHSLSLHPDDYADLKKRGLTDEQMNRWGVKSVKRWHPLSVGLPSKLPGVHTSGRSLNIFSEGYACPIRDINGRVVACQIRSRSSEKNIPKYYWLTSKTQKNPHGATAHLTTGELPLSVFRPATCTRPAIALVEGTGVKPFLTAERRQIVTIGAAGGQFASSPQTLKATLEGLTSTETRPNPSMMVPTQDGDITGTSDHPPNRSDGRPQTEGRTSSKTSMSESPKANTIIEFYPDAGSPSNVHVLRQYRATWRLLQTLGFTVQVMWWNQLTKASPDIDELDDFSRIQTITIEEFESIARHPKQLLDQISSLLGLGKRKKKKPTPQTHQSPSSSTPNIHTYTKGNRIQTWKQAIAHGYRYILDSSGTGTGKSFDTGTLKPSEINDVEGIIYLSDQHRNPTVSTLKESNEWLDLEARHAGLTIEASPNGSQRIRRVRKGEHIHIPANCSRNQTIRTLQEKNVKGAETSALICGFCPLKETCTQSHGHGYGFLKQRRDVLSAEKFRAHPDSLPDPDDYTYHNKLIIWDEPGQTFNIRHDIHVTLKDLEQTIAALLKNESVFDSVKPLLAALVPYIDGSASVRKFGLTHEQVVSILPNPESISLEEIQTLLTSELDFLDALTLTDAQPLDFKINATHSLNSLVSTNPAEKSDEAIASYTTQKVVKNWLPELIKILQGSQRGALSIQKNKLTISLLSSRHRTVVNAAKATIFLDATLSRSDLALKLQCQEDDIYEIKQEQEHHHNLTVIQITDIGRMGMQRGRQQTQRAQAVVNHIRETDPHAKVIDFKKNQADGSWWRDSRGVNDFDHVKTLILVGTPCRNIIDQTIEFCLLNGDPTFDQDSFAEYVNRIIEADIQQAIGRIRSYQRTHEALTVVLISNFATEAAHKKVCASEITEKAQTKKEKFIKTVLKAMLQIKDRGEKITQTSVARQAGYSQQYISRFWNLLQMLLEDFNSTRSSDSTQANLICHGSINHRAMQTLPKTRCQLSHTKCVLSSCCQSQWLRTICQRTSTRFCEPSHSKGCYWNFPSG